MRFMLVGSVFLIGIASAKAEESCTAGFLPVLCMKVTITGDATLSGPTSMAVNALTCADWASGITPGGKGKLEFRSEFTPIDGTQFALEGQVEGYQGPGFYEAESLAGWGSPFMVLVDQTRWENWVIDTAPAGASLKIAADGSGTLNFNGFITDHAAPPPHKAISGNVTWTCVDP